MKLSDLIKVSDPAEVKRRRCAYIGSKLEARRKSYLARSAGIKGDWRDDKWSANNLSRALLW